MVSDTVLCQRLPERFNAQARLVQHARRLRAAFMLGAGDARYRFEIEGGRLAAVRKGPFLMNEWDFSMEADPEVWQQFWRPVPPPGFHDILALIKSRRLLVQGNLYPLMSNLLYFKAMLALPRSLGEA